jgi:hypothetical protein
MMSKKLAQRVDQNLGEECRKALENAYGFKIPLPNSAKKKLR